MVVVVVVAVVVVAVVVVVACERIQCIRPFRAGLKLWGNEWITRRSSKVFIFPIKCKVGQIILLKIE